MVLSGGHSEIARTDRVRLIQMALREQLPRLAAGRVRRLRGAPLPGLLAQGRRARASSSTRGFVEALDGRGPHRGHRRRDRRVPRRHRADDLLARPSAPARHRHRRLRGGGRQHRRRADLHHHGRLRARHRSSSRAPSTGTRTSCAGPSASPPRSSRRCKGEIRIADLVADKRPPERAVAKTFLVPPDVAIDNALSSRQTVIEVTGLDRPGLLYELTTALGQLNLNIASAHVATFGEKAVDVFYVTDLTGTEGDQPDRQVAIRRRDGGLRQRRRGDAGRGTRRPDRLAAAARGLRRRPRRLCALDFTASSPDISANPDTIIRRNP